jgi:hypothetical protein
MAQFRGVVEKVFVGGRLVGMVYRDPNPPAEMDEMWVALTRGGQAVDSKQAGILAVLEYAAAHPDHEIR